MCQPLTSFDVYTSLLPNTHMHSSGCTSEHGNCTGPNICTCQSGYWGSDCAQRCTCTNGVCNDGIQSCTHVDSYMSLSLPPPSSIIQSLRSVPPSLRPGGYRDMFRMQLHGLCRTKLRPLHFQRSGSDHIRNSHCCHRHHCTHRVVHQEVRRTLVISIAWIKLTSGHEYNMDNEL